MICQHGFRALLHGNMSQLGVSCGLLLRTGKLISSAVHCRPLLQPLETRNFGEIVLKRRLSCVAGMWAGTQDPQRLPRGVLVVPRRSAGHSKWQNIKHIKQANDLAKSVAFSKMAVRIRLAVGEGKSTDPKMNFQLAHLMEEAKRINMPVSKIDSILKASKSGKQVALIPFTMEAKGPGGTFLIIEILTDNLNRSRSQIKFKLSRCGATVVDGIRHMFKHKGIVAVEPVPGNLNLETAIDVAIETGAEEVLEAAADDGTEVLEFLCEPRDFYKVKTALAEKGYTVKYSKLSYLANQRVSLSDEHLELMSKIADVLDSHPDVDQFYDNVE